MDVTARYFVAIIPPPAVAHEIITLKNFFREKYQSRAALNAPSHITLHMPFRWKLRNEESLIRTLGDFYSTTESFDLALSGFGCFEPRVIFIDVVENCALRALQKKTFRFFKKELNIFNAVYKDLPFHPHITVAFRDLKRPSFHEAWERFRNESFFAEFRVSSVSLLKDNSRSWEVLHVFDWRPTI